VAVRCAVVPSPAAPAVAATIRAAGGVVVEAAADADALLWTDPLDVAGLGEFWRWRPASDGSSCRPVWAGPERVWRKHG